MKVFVSGETLLSAALLLSLVLAHDGEDGKWLLKTNSADDACTDVVFARMSGHPCPDEDSCRPDTDGDGYFQDSVGGGCVTDREGYLQTVFGRVPYLKFELYSTNCTDDDEEPYEIKAYLADGACHPTDSGHFKIAESDSGATSVFISWEGCDTQYWNETLPTLTDTELNTGACVTHQGKSWKAYLVSMASSSSGPSSSASASASSSSDSPSGSAADSSGSASTTSANSTAAAATSTSTSATVTSVTVLVWALVALRMAI